MTATISSSKTIECLPRELFLDICQYLSVDDIKQLSQASIRLRMIVWEFAWQRCIVVGSAQQQQQGGRRSKRNMVCSNVSTVKPTSHQSSISCEERLLRPVQSRVLVSPDQYTRWFDCGVIKQLYLSSDAMLEVQEMIGVNSSRHPYFEVIKHFRQKFTQLKYVEMPVATQMDHNYSSGNGDTTRHHHHHAWYYRRQNKKTNNELSRLLPQLNQNPNQFIINPQIPPTNHIKPFTLLIPDNQNNNITKEDDDQEAFHKTHFQDCCNAIVLSRIGLSFQLQTQCIQHLSLDVYISVLTIPFQKFVKEIRQFENLQSLMMNIWSTNNADEAFYGLQWLPDSPLLKSCVIGSFYQRVPRVLSKMKDYILTRQQEEEEEFINMSNEKEEEEEKEIKIVIPKVTKLILTCDFDFEIFKYLELSCIKGLEINTISCNWNLDSTKVECLVPILREITELKLVMVAVADVVGILDLFTTSLSSSSSSSCSSSSRPSVYDHSPFFPKLECLEIGIDNGASWDIYQRALDTSGSNFLVEELQQQMNRHYECFDGTKTSHCLNCCNHKDYDYNNKEEEKKSRKKEENLCLFFLTRKKIPFNLQPLFEILTQNIEWYLSDPYQNILNLFPGNTRGTRGHYTYFDDYLYKNYVKVVESNNHNNCLDFQNNNNHHHHHDCKNLQKNINSKESKNDDYHNNQVEFNEKEDKTNKIYLHSTFSTKAWAYYFIIYIYSGWECLLRRLNKFSAPSLEMLILPGSLPIIQSPSFRSLVLGNNDKKSREIKLIHSQQFSSTRNYNNNSNNREGMKNLCELLLSNEKYLPLVEISKVEFFNYNDNNNEIVCKKLQTIGQYLNNNNNKKINTTTKDNFEIFDNSNNNNKLDYKVLRFVHK